MNVYLNATRVALDPRASIGQGGEAEVYDIGTGQALKIFKSPRHPDYSGHKPAQDAARARLDAHQTKLPSFPQGLPDRVIAPATLAHDRKSRGRVVGYAMPLIAGADSLGHLSEPRQRRQPGVGNRLIAALRDLHDSVSALHQRGVVIGDFNDNNVLIQHQRAYLIDADSFQFGRFPCAVFTERFVDPKCCDPNAAAPVLARPYDYDSDWYAFHVLTMRALLSVGPYGGVYRPKSSAKRIPHSSRPLHRITVFAPEVIYPKPAIPYQLLPDELIDRLQEVFCHDQRGPLPRPLLDQLRWTSCRRCGAEHARAACPACRQKPRVAAQPMRTRRGNVEVTVCAHTDGLLVDACIQQGALRWLSLHNGRLQNRHGQTLADGLVLAPGRRVACIGDGAVIADSGHLQILTPPASASATGGASPTGPARDLSTQHLVADMCGNDTVFAVGSDGTLVWAAGGQLLARRSATLSTGRTNSSPAAVLRNSYASPTLLGNVLQRQTRVWLGESLGLTWYRANAVCVASLFAPHRRGLDDSVELPPMRGRLLGLHATLGSRCAWLFWRTQAQAHERAHAALFSDTGALIATAEANADDETSAWMLAGAGSAAVGEALFVPTNDGIVRVEASGDRLHKTRHFPDTAPFVSAADKLFTGPGGLYVASAKRIARLALS